MPTYKFEIAQHGEGFVVRHRETGEHYSPRELHLADAAQQHRLLELAHHDALQGEGFRELREKLMRRARDIARQAKKVVPKHLGNIARLFGSLRRGRGPQKVHEDDERHAAVSQDVYLPPHERKIDGYRKDLSSDEIGVYHQPRKADSLLVAMRGSQNADDVITDAHLALGNLHKTDRWARTRKHVEKLREKFPHHRFDYTGHSLGATLALKASQHEKEKGRQVGKVVAFNPGVGLKGVEGDRKGRIYSVHGDAVSSLAMLSHPDVRVVDPKKEGADALEAHGIHNFVK